MMKKNQKSTKKPTKLSPTIQLFLAIGLFGVAVLASNGEQMTAWEITIFQAIYGLPGFLHGFFLAITNLGSIYMLGLLLLLYLAKWHYHVVLRLLMTGTLAYVVSGVAKDLWGRARPFELLTDVVSLDYIVRGPGFPSGHMALAVALALTVGHYLPKKYHWVVPIWIVGVGLSRVYLGVHAPLDIVGGFAIGWGSYALFRHVRLYDITFHRESAKKVRLNSRKA